MAAPELPSGDAYWRALQTSLRMRHKRNTCTGADPDQGTHGVQAPKVLRPAIKRSAGAAAAHAPPGPHRRLVIRFPKVGSPNRVSVKTK